MLQEHSDHGFSILSMVLLQRWEEDPVRGRWCGVCEGRSVVCE